MTRPENVLQVLTTALGAASPSVEDDNDDNTSQRTYRYTQTAADSRQTVQGTYMRLACWRDTYSSTIREIGDETAHS